MYKGDGLGCLAVFAVIGFLAILALVVIIIYWAIN